jgi:hypothetical protein
MSLITEWHSSDLTSPCLRRVELTHRGKRVGYTTSALYRGSLFHNAIKHAQLMDADNIFAIGEAVSKAHAEVAAEAEASGRPLSQSVINEHVSIQNEVGNLVAEAIARVLAPNGAWLPWAVECPIRWTLDDERLPKPITFASHLDAILSDGGVLRVIDWKTGDDRPTQAYLTRSLQLGLYWLMVRHGSVCVNGEWVDFDYWPSVEWVVVDNFKPFGRKTVTDGREYQKGDTRPIESIVIPARFVPGVHDRWLIDRLVERVRMAEAGFWPHNPDPVGCYVCDCRVACQGEQQ